MSRPLPFDRFFSFFLSFFFSLRLSQAFFSVHMEIYPRGYLPSYYNNP